MSNDSDPPVQGGSTSMDSSPVEGVNNQEDPNRQGGASVPRGSALSKESNTDFPHLPTRHSPATRPTNLFFSQPARSTITTRPIRNNLSQQEHTTKKRKASSPINVTQIPPMFPFSFGPSQPLPPNEPCVPESPEDKFLNVLFSTLQYILSEVKTFEELANIDITYLTIGLKCYLFETNMSSMEVISMHIINLWGSYNQNHNGVTLVQALNSSDLVLLNDGSSTRFQNSGHKSVVDLTFSSPDIANLIEWRSLDDTLGSDHFPILLEIKSQRAYHPHTIIPKTKWNTKKADWGLFNLFCENNFSNCLPSSQNVEDMYQFFINGINEAALQSIPKNKPFIKRNNTPAPWWDQEWEAAVTNRRRELLKYKQHSNEANYISCKREIAKTKRLLENKAKLHWKKFCGNLNKNTVF
nr:unnamed protein product [Callosobruchus analis]